MNDKARLQDDTFSRGLETVIQLTRHAGFTAELGERIRQPGGAERAVSALRREFLPEPLAMPIESGGSPYHGGRSDDLPPNHYRIRVNRGPLPSMATLKDQFKGGVFELFDGKYQWKKHSSRLGASDVTAEEVIAYVHDFGYEINSEEAIAWGLEHGYVPADEKEAHAVGIDPQTCDLQRKNWLVALGSSAMAVAGRHVTVLDCFCGGRVFGGRWFGSGWSTGGRFLFVRRYA